MTDQTAAHVERETPQNSGRPDHWHPNRKRPSLYDEGVLDRFLDKLASTAQSIKQICATDDMPRPQEIFIACGRDPALRSRIAQAREAQQDVIVDELLEIADTATVEEVNLAKLRIWTRQWAAARFAPKKYGENQRVEVQHTISETAARVLMELSDRAKQRQALAHQTIDVTPVHSLGEGVAADRNALTSLTIDADGAGTARVSHVEGAVDEAGVEAPRGATTPAPAAAAAASSPRKSRRK